MLNSLYVFYIQENRLFVAAKNWKDARNIIIRSPEYRNCLLTEITGHRIAAQVTDTNGILSPEYVFAEIPWMTCRCGCRSFMLIDDGSACRCHKCGRETRLDF